MIYPILRWQRDAVLTTAAADVTEFNGRLAAMIDDMYATLYSVNGVGLAAPQIGMGIRLAVIDTGAGKSGGGKLALINPTIIAVEGKQSGQEGCLSLPGFRALVTRPASVTVRYQDLNGAWQQRTADGLLARVIMHECDHLAGELIVHRISSLKRSMIERKVRRLMKRGRW